MAIRISAAEILVATIQDLKCTTQFVANAASDARCHFAPPVSGLFFAAIVLKKNAIKRPKEPEGEILIAEIRDVLTLKKNVCIKPLVASAARSVKYRFCLPAVGQPIAKIVSSVE